MTFNRSRLTLAAGLLSLSVASAYAAVPTPTEPHFDIKISFGSGLTTEQEGYFTQAANFWKSVIVGYAQGVTSSYLQGVSIIASATNIDGLNGTLGRAGPTYSYFPSSVGSHTYTFVQNGTMEFDTADMNKMITDGIFLNVIKHEMAHVLGFGTMWGGSNSVYNQAGAPGRYTGAYALDAYRTEFNQSGASYVPVEQEGGQGTANAHWDENYGGNGLTGILDAQRRDMRDELMTGWINPNSFVSNTTIQSFRDLGYAVASPVINVPSPAPVPVPGAIWLFASAIALFGWNLSKRKA